MPLEPGSDSDNDNVDSINFKKIIHSLNNINSTLNNIHNRVSILEKNQIKNMENINQIINMLNSGDIIDNCKKMGNHINFVENVYNSVKYPLSFICNKITKYSMQNSLDMQNSLF